MKIELESTTKLVTLNGVPARLWQGRTAAGVQVHAFITRIAVDRSDDTSQFEAELVEQTSPRPELDVYPLRMIL
jgi:hypothetical protein